MTALIKTGAIARKYSVSPRTAIRWSHVPSFPKPVIEKFKANEYDPVAVDRWVSRHCYRSGVFGDWRLKTPRMLAEEAA